MAYKRFHINDIPYAAMNTIRNNCRDGDLRLQNGSNVREGRVEICFNQAWGTICDSGYGLVDANVICGQLTFSNEGLHYIHYKLTCCTESILLISMYMYIGCYPPHFCLPKCIESA